MRRQDRHLFRWVCGVLPSLLSGLGLSACSGVGPTTLAAGRPAYNAIINQTEDEQILSIIVRQRYDETFGMLAVASVTASVKVSATVGGNLGIGPRSGFEGNLVPLSGGAAYEDNPTISYVPLRGEQFVERMLAPISPEQAMLLSRMATADFEPMRVLIRRVGGIANPRYASNARSDLFDRCIDGYCELREAGVLDVLSGTEGSIQLLLHDMDPAQRARAAELFKACGVEKSPAASEPSRIAVRFLVGAAWADGLDIETPSALEVLRAAGLGIEVPRVHIDQGLVRPAGEADARAAMLRIGSSVERPAPGVTAVEFRGWWYYVDPGDFESKQAFMFLRTLIGMRLDGPLPQAAPVLTVPVGG